MTMTTLDVYSSPIVYARADEGDDAGGDTQESKEKEDEEEEDLIEGIEEGDEEELGSVEEEKVEPDEE